MTPKGKSSDRVDEEIRSRIRSLLLSRNRKRPPQSPYPSEEQPRGSFANGSLANLNCRTIKSSSISSDPLNSEIRPAERTRSLWKSADMANDGQPSTSESTVIRHALPLWTSSSVNDLQTSTEDGRYCEHTHACCHSHTLCESEEKSKPSHLQLRNMKTVSTNPPSCLETSTRIPLNDTEIQAHEMDFCLPSEPNSMNLSSYIVSQTPLPAKQLRAEPTDLACCAPGQINCRQHRIISKNTQAASGQSNQRGHDFKAIASDLAKDVSRIGNSIARVVAAKSPLTLTDIHDDDPRRPHSPFKILRRSQSFEQIRSNLHTVMPEGCSKNKRISSRQNGTSVTEVSSSGSLTSCDKFPHVAESLAAAAAKTQSYSTIIHTNFSLPGTKCQSTPEDLKNSTISGRLSNAVTDSTVHLLNPNSLPDTKKQNVLKPGNSPLDSKASLKQLAVSIKSSNGSLKPRKPQSASLLSGASKASAYQHSLLKTSVSGSQPLEVELPLPPLLTSITSTSTLIPPENTSRELNKFQTGPYSESQEETQRVKTVIEREDASCKPNLAFPTSFAQKESSDAVHIDFGPEIKNSLPSAVQVTINKAIEDIDVSSNPSPGVATGASRRLVAQSLVEPVKDTESQKTSNVNILPKMKIVEANGLQPNEHQVKNSHCNKAEKLQAETITNKHEPTIKTLWPDPSRHSLSLMQELEASEKTTRSGGKIESKENDDALQKSTSLIRKGNKPSGNEGSIPKNHKKARSGVSERGSCAVVPNRQSSRLRVLSPKYCGVNISNQISSKQRDLVSKIKQMENGLPRANRAAKSESSAGSRDGPCSDADHQPEQSLILEKNHADPCEVDLLSKRSPCQGHARKDTVRWLQNLLSSSGEYQPQFTNLPPRKRQNGDSTAFRQRSQTEQLRPVARFILAAPNMLNTQVDLQKLSTPTDSDSKALVSATFTKTINDLENLLNEALIIARLAADKNIEDSNRKLLKKRGGSCSGCSSDSESASVGSIHESMRSYSESSSSADDETEHFSNNNLHQQSRATAISIPKISEPTNRPSGWPPSGRGPTPYPPNTIPPSKESIFEGIPFLERIDSATKEAELINGTDPRWNHPEIGLSSTATQQGSAPLVELKATEPFNKKTEEGLTKTGINKISLVLMSLKGKSHTLSGRTKIDEVGVGADIRSEKYVSAVELHPEELQNSCGLESLQFTHSEEVDFGQGYGHRNHGNEQITKAAIVEERETVELRDVARPNLPVTNISRRKMQEHLFSLKNTRHVSLRDHIGFSLTRSHKRQAIARDWSPSRKRFCAAVACISTALVGILVGIYAGETPAIQYWIVDFHHYTVLGNVFFFIGLSIPTFLFWPLPLLHGRKPYILGAMSLAMPLLFPQAVAVGQFRSPYVSIWRIALLLPRALMGLCLGFANMNFMSILTDLFGASLQSHRPHQEHVDKFDVRRHGGGMGVWLGLWTWSAMGSIGLGFLIGGVIINGLPPVWGFYISITIIAFVLLLNVLTPEVRRSAYRRSVAEVKNGEQVSRRLARGEVKMHLVQTGPKWWGEEFYYGMKLSIKMLTQPGFTVMALYVAWMYGQIVLIVLLLGSLCSNSYRFKSHEVGAAVAVVPVGALIAIPFQKASLFSRDRNHDPTSDEETYKKKIKWSSHLVRRVIFVLTLPFAGLAYTLSARGPPIPFILPILFAGLIAFLSNLAMAECHGLIMETYDTSDLQPGMTGRSRGSAGDKSVSKRTNYSSFPRVTSAFAVTQGLGYLVAAAASGVGGTLTRNFGQQAASGIMAFILLILSLMLLGVLVRFKDVQIIPNTKKGEMERYHNARAAAIRQSHGAHEEEPWRPIIIGNPHHSTRRMSILELGSMSRFSDIRQKNRLVDEQSLEARHPNQQMMMDVKLKLKEKELQVVQKVRRSLSRGSSRGSQRSKYSEEDRYRNQEQSDLGGHREMGRMHSGNGFGTRAADIQE